MKKSDIKFTVSLDDNNIPEKIEWTADEKIGDIEETNAVAISLWDNKQFNTMRMDLWTKDMAVEDMKRFCVDSIGGLAETVKNATGDDVMAALMQELCTKLVKHIEDERKNIAGQQS